MRFTFRRIFGVIFLGMLVACTAPANQHSPTGITETPTEINIDDPTATVMANYNWVIFEKDHAAEMGIVKGLVQSDDYWTPTVDDILQLEEKIAGFLSQNPRSFSDQAPVWERLDGYHRQYIGLERDGSPIIYGNYFCSDEGKNWRQDFVFVLDGGECFFQIEYDVNSGTFIGLMVNGVS